MLKLLRIEFRKSIKSLEFLLWAHLCYNGCCRVYPLQSLWIVKLEIIHLASLLIG